VRRGEIGPSNNDPPRYLDTSFLIRALLNGTPESAALDLWITSGEAVEISSVAWAEFLCGPVADEAVAAARQALGAPTPFTADDATFTANLFNATGRRRGSLPDCMIAAVARRIGATIATSNAEDFRRFEPLGIVLAKP
jgi:predicted nucleic acid-binding protein